MESNIGVSHAFTCIASFQTADQTALGPLVGYQQKGVTQEIAVANMESNIGVSHAFIASFQTADQTALGPLVGYEQYPPPKDCLPRL